MAVTPLDLREIFSIGKTYADWLAHVVKNPRMREDLDKYHAEATIPAETASHLKGLKRSVHILAIAEDWCGDVRRNTPVLAKLCDLNPYALHLRCIDKETHPDLMVRYLTNAAAAIPIFIFLNENFVEIGNWGPRPYECKRLMARGKAAGNIDAAREKIMAYYNQDKHQSTIAELTVLIDTAAATSV